MYAKLKYGVRLVAVLGMVGISRDVGCGQDIAVAAPIQNWSYQHHSSTLTEGYLRGQAMAISAAGEFNYFTSLAAVNQQEAFRRALENQQLYLKTYIQMKEMRRDYWEKYGPRPPSPEARKRINESRLPDRLSDSQFDRSTGRLYWPHVLRQSAYDSLRERVNELFAARTVDTSGDGSPNEREIAQVVDAMRKLLKTNIDRVTPQQYVNAATFLASVAFEAKQTSAQVPAPAAAPAPVETPPAPPAAGT
jgi:hypothetical protein